MVTNIPEWPAIDGKDGFYVTWNMYDTIPQTAANYGIGHIVSQVPCEVISWSARWGVASSSGTVSLEKVSSGTAKGSGSVISNSLSTAGTANIPVAGTLVDTRSAGIPYRQLRLGDSLAIKSGGTLTSLKDLTVTVYLKPLGRGNYR